MVIGNKEFFCHEGTKTLNKIIEYYVDGPYLNPYLNLLKLSNEANLRITEWSSD